MPKILYFAITGVISGVASFFIAKATGDLYFTAGAAFGVGIAIAMTLSRKLKPAFGSAAASYIFWLIASTGAYYSAVYVALQASKVIQNNAFAFLGAGMVGGAIMLFAFHFFLRTLDTNNFFALVILAGILGLTGLIEGEYGVLALYTVWQGGMALALGYALENE